MSARYLFLTGVIAAALALAGCGKPTSGEHNHAEHAGAEGTGESGVAFKAGRGLRLSPEVIPALALTTAEVETRPLAGGLSVTVQVFATAPRVLATARVVPTVLVEHGSFGLFEPLPTARRAGRAALGFGSQVERIDADQLGAREAAQFGERAVHVLHAPVGAEQQRSKRRLPRELQQLR